MSGKDVESLRKWYDITKEVEDALLKDASARGEPMKPHRTKPLKPSKLWIRSKYGKPSDLVALVRVS